MKPWPLLVLLTGCASQKHLITEAPKPTALSIILMMQCDRPLGIVGIDSEGNRHVLDARDFTPEQIDQVFATVAKAHQHVVNVPCVSHSLDELPGGKHGVSPTTEI
jgi:hypothetical protein